MERRAGNTVRDRYGKGSSNRFMVLHFGVSIVSFSPFDRGVGADLTITAASAANYWRIFVASFTILAA